MLIINNVLQSYKKSRLVKNLNKIYWKKTKQKYKL